MFRILVADSMSAEGLAPLLDAEGVELVQKKVSEVEDELGTFDAIFVRSATKVTEALLERMPNVKIIARAGVGVDNIDLPAATKRGVIVVNAPDGNTISTCEHTFAMMQAVVRKVPQAVASLKAKEWNRNAFLGMELNNKTLGIVGFGRIGSEIAKRARAFNMTILVFDPFLTKARAEQFNVRSVDLDTIIRESDVFTFHTPLTPETRNMINAERISQMKDGVYIVNCARGGIINEQHLYDAVVAGKVAGVALDVFETEPATDNPLVGLPQVIATPHIAASTVEAQLNVAVHVSREVVNYIEGRPVTSSVNLPAISKDVYDSIRPYYELAKRMGSFLSQMLKSPVTEINIDYFGEADREKSTVTRALIAEFIRPRVANTVNEVNAELLCKENGITFGSKVVTSNFGYSNGITVTAVTEDATFTVKGTYIAGYGARIVQVDGYLVDFDPEGHIVYISHDDKPGVIGHVGGLLGEYGVNIASMQVGRKTVGGSAIMLLTVDKPLQADVLAALQSAQIIKSVSTIEL
ncbi:MAG: phosphoglycerate dehydrogenase [Bacilli bacterium]